MLKPWQKIKIHKDNRIIKKYKLCGFTLLRKEKSPTKKKWNFLGVTVCKKEPCLNYDITSLFCNTSCDKIEKIDILIPVYNGYEYLKPLFESIKDNTDLPYHIYVVNDCSPDERIKIFLQSLETVFTDSITILHNEENLGFVKSVNKLFKCSKHHVVLLNTDVVLPKKWATRLLAPIFKDETVASVTPFSNAATIFSLPCIYKDNSFTESLEAVNNSLEKLSASQKFLKFATGVGFCMAINKKALLKVGLFDEIFEKGYGEENDWCQRAISQGFYNTLAANLFVWHKHGGSFQSEEKKKLCQQHMNIICQRYPQYSNQIVNNSNNQYYQLVHFVAELLYFKGLAKSSEVWFDHTWGGGANIYRQIKFEKLKEKTLCLLVTNEGTESYCLSYQYQGYSNQFYFNKINQLVILLKQLKVEKIVVNNLASYAHNVSLVLQKIKEIKNENQTFISFRGHDLACICPTIVMLNDNDKYCQCQSLADCGKCFAHNHNILIKTKFIQQWQNEWQDFLSNTADEIIVFSKSTHDIYARLYPAIKKKMQIIPHQIDELRDVKIKKHKNINIAVLGSIGIPKGSNQIRKMDKLLEKYPDVTITIIGIIDYGNLKNIKVTGAYDVKKLPDIMEENNIDLIFISSIVPETFSYTTSEAMSMNIPVACYNFGAQAEKVKKYDKGLIIDNIENEEKALMQIIDFVKKIRKN